MGLKHFFEYLEIFTDNRPKEQIYDWTVHQQTEIR